MKDRRRISIIIFILIMIPAFAIVLRSGCRYHALNKLEQIPLARQRMAIQPSRKVLQGFGEIGCYVNLGYSRFALPPGLSMEMSTHGVHQTCISLTNQMLSIVFLAPFAENPAIGVQSEIDVENSEYPDFWQVLFMNRKQFIRLIAALGHKAGTTRGWNEVYSFSTSNNVGLVRIGDSPKDRSHASVSLSSKNGNRHIGFHLKMSHGSSISIEKTLDTLLDTFEFTVELIPENQALAKIIRKAMQNY